MGPDCLGTRRLGASAARTGVRAYLFFDDGELVRLIRCAVPKAKLRAVSRSRFAVQCRLMSFLPTAVADLLGEGDKLVLGLVA